MCDKEPVLEIPMLKPAKLPKAQISVSVKNAISRGFKYDWSVGTCKFSN